MRFSPTSRRPLLIPVALGTSLLVESYQHTLGKTLQANSTYQKSCATEMSHKPSLPALTPAEHLVRARQQRLLHPTQEGLWALVDSFALLHPRKTLKSVENPASDTLFAKEQVTYRNTTRLAIVLDHCRATWDEVYPIFQQCSLPVESFPRYQRYVKCQYAYATAHQMTEDISLLSPQFFSDLLLKGSPHQQAVCKTLFAEGTALQAPDFVSYDQTTEWGQDWKIEKDQVCYRMKTMHLPASQAYTACVDANLTICSSLHGFSECGSLADEGTTCLHGMQPLLVHGCTLLKQRIQEAYHLQQVPHFVLRGGTEIGHDGDQTWVAGQMAPKYENTVVVTGKPHCLMRAQVQGMYKLFVMHGFGNVVDIGVYDATTARAVHAFLDAGEPLVYGFRYRQLDDDCFVVVKSHGHGAGLHHHTAFLTAEMMQWVLADLQGEGRDTLLLEQVNDDGESIMQSEDSTETSIPKGSKLLLDTLLMERDTLENH